MSDELFLLVFVFGEPGFLAIEQVLVRHRVFVVLVQCESLVEEVESFVNKLLLLFFRRGIILVVDDDPDLTLTFKVGLEGYYHDTMMKGYLKYTHITILY